MRVVVLLSLVACAAAYSSGSSYASGKASAYASGKASASASAPAPAAGPAPAPAPGKVTEHRITAEIKLTGVDVATFSATTTAGKAARTAFKNTVAAQLKVCGADGKSKCTGDDVVIVSVTAARRAGGVKIDFYVKTKSADTAKAAATTLNTALTADGGKTFSTALVAEAKKGGAAATLGAATITTVVTKAPAAKTVQVPAPAPSPKKVSAAPATAVVSMASVAFAALALW